MVEFRWLETTTHVVNGEPFLDPVTVRTLQYRKAPEIVHVDADGTTWKCGTDWKDVPVVSVEGGERG